MSSYMELEYVYLNADSDRLSLILIGINYTNPILVNPMMNKISYHRY